MTMNDEKRTGSVDLARLTKGEVHNLSGHERGLAARELFHLDALDQQGCAVKIEVPADVYAVSPSFVQGFLSKSVHNLGNSRKAFYSRFEILGTDLIKRQFERGLSAILTDRSQPVI